MMWSGVDIYPRFPFVGGSVVVNADRLDIDGKHVLDDRPRLGS
jgi:hypothetical protein